MRFDRAGSSELHIGPPKKYFKCDKKTEVFQEHFFLLKNTHIFEKWLPKGAQIGEGISRVAPLGAPSEPQSIFTPKSVATGIQQVAQVRQNDTHSAPKVPPEPEMWLKNNIKNWRAFPPRT